MTVTFGFEAEYQSNAAELIAGLYERRLAGDRILHSYHCDCNLCSFVDEYDRSVYHFRGQTDSSCSGEIISKVYTSWTEAAPAVQALCALAVEYDAEPGWDAGLHVHVMPSDGMSRARAARNYMLWESALRRYASGAFETQRSNNASLAAEVCGYLGVSRDNIGDLDDSEIVEATGGIDRHANVNFNTRHNTWEFRFWNSTRAAWRIELYCRLSRALVEPAFHDELDLIDPANSANDGAFLGALDAAGFTRTAELLRRQLTYNARLRPSGAFPETFTVLAV